MKKTELKTTELVCENGVCFCKTSVAVSNYYPLVEDDENATEFAGIRTPDKPLADDKKEGSKKLKIRAKFSFANLVHASVDLDYEKIGETKAKTTKKKKIKDSVRRC